MRKVVRKIGIGFCCLLLMAGSVAATPPAVPLPQESFKMGMYRVKDSLKMKLMLEKEEGKAVSIKLYDNKGRVLQRYVLGKKAGIHSIQFDFASVPDGAYRMVVTSGDERMVKDIRLSTAHVVEVPARTLVALN